MRNWFVRSLLLSSALGLSLAVPALAQRLGPMGPGPGGPRPFAPWMFAAAGTFMVLRIVLVVGLILLVWKVLGSPRLWQQADRATVILRERYARGEIDEEEYRKRLGMLA
jgi:putative membrane protein